MPCCSRTSGAVKALESSIWIVYDTAPDAIAHWKLIGCVDGFSPLGGESSAGASGTGGVDGGNDTAPSLTTKASPQKISGSPFQTVSNAPTVVGKLGENVFPVT